MRRNVARLVTSVTLVAGRSGFLAPSAGLLNLSVDRDYKLRNLPLSALTAISALASQTGGARRGTPETTDE